MSDIIRRSGYIGACFVALFLLTCLLVGQVKYAMPQTLMVTGSSVFVIGALLYARKRSLSYISDRTFWIGVSFLLISAFCVEAYIVVSHPFDWATDPRLCREQAEYMLTTWGMSPDLSGYFAMYPHNINILIVLGALYRLFGDYTYVVYVFLVLVNLSSLFACLTVRNITKSNFASIVSLLLLQVFCIFTTRTYMPYTSNLALIFPILMIYVYTTKISTPQKAVFIPFIAAIGYQAKLTSLIAFIAIVVIEVIRYVINQKLYTKKDIGIAIASTILSFMLCAGLKAICWNEFGYQEDDNRVKGFTYFLYLGQNTQSGGQWDAEYVKNSEYIAPKAERDAYYASVIKRDITERGLLGNIKFYVAKTAICWGCTYQDYVKFDNQDKSWVFVLRHCIWFFVFTCAMLSVFACRNKYNLAMLLTLTGVMVYLFLSEGSFTYVIMFSPIVFAMAGITISKLCKE